MSDFFTKDDRESVNAYLFRTFEIFMEMFGLVTTKDRLAENF